MARSEAQKAAERNYEKKRGPRKRKRIDKRGKRDRTSEQRDRRARARTSAQAPRELEAVAAAAVAAAAAIEHAATPAFDSATPALDLQDSALEMGINQYEQNSAPSAAGAKERTSAGEKATQRAEIRQVQLEAANGRQPPRPATSRGAGLAAAAARLAPVERCTAPLSPPPTSTSRFAPAWRALTLGAIWRPGGTQRGVPSVVALHRIRDLEGRRPGLVFGRDASSTRAASAVATLIAMYGLRP